MDVKDAARIISESFKKALEDRFIIQTPEEHSRSLVKAYFMFHHGLTLGDDNKLRRPDSDESLGEVGEHSYDGKTLKINLKPNMPVDFALINLDLKLLKASYE